MAGLSAANPLFIQVAIGPAGAVQGGANWRLYGDTNYPTPYNPSFLRAITTNGASIEYRTITGWDSPTNQIASNAPGSLTVISALYSLSATQSVSPAGVFIASGYVGGPIAPVSTSYTVTNAGQASLNWAVLPSDTWLSISPASGTLAAASSTTVIVSMNPNAYALTVSSHTNTLTFTNQSNGLGTTTRLVILTLATHPPVSLSNPHLETDGSLTLSISGISGRPYSILSSGNLSDPIGNWVAVTNVTAPAVFTLPALTGAGVRFYRANEQ